MRNEVTNDQFSTFVNCKIGRKVLCGDLVAEVPANWPAAVPSRKLVTYRVTVTTGEEMGGSTAADVFLELTGQLGSSGVRMLRRPVNVTDVPFSMGSRDQFDVCAVWLGVLESVRVGHVGTGIPACWYLEEVTVKEHENGRQEYRFPAGAWLDSEIGDRQTDRTFPVDTASLPEDLCSQGDYKVTVWTGEEPAAGTEAQVSVTVCGDVSSSTADLPRTRLQPGSSASFSCSFGPVGTVVKVRVEHDGHGRDPAWLLHRLSLDSLFTRETHTIECNRWLSRDHEDGQTVREFPVTQLDVKVYKLLVETEDKVLSSGETAAKKKQNKPKMFALIRGTLGDCGKRELRRANDKPSVDHFKPGHRACFDIEAVDLGELQHVVISFQSSDSQARWRPGNIYVKDDEDIYVFPCHRYLGKKEKDTRTELKISLDPEAEVDIADDAFESPDGVIERREPVANQRRSRSANQRLGRAANGKKPPTEFEKFGDVKNPKAGTAGRKSKVSIRQTPTTKPGTPNDPPPSEPTTPDPLPATSDPVTAVERELLTPESELGGGGGGGGGGGELKDPALLKRQRSDASRC